MTTIPYQILEVANCHGGNYAYMMSLLDEFESFDQFGIKFQPLHPDRIATPDYAWYNVYHELVFTPEQWNSILTKAYESKEVWIDLFDTYGVEIFNLNKNLVKGIKLQPSVLYNESVINALEQIKLTNQKLIINISALEISEIKERLNSLKTRLTPKDIWIEVGFQSFPTELLDSALVKIKTIKEIFNCKVVFADHVDGKSDDALWLPIIAAMIGADVIEKHIMHSTLETKYDYFSSINVHAYKTYITKLQNYISLKDQPFINDREKAYLNNSIQIPISSHQLRKGSLIKISGDLMFKRSGKSGLNTKSLIELQETMHVLNRTVEPGNTFQLEDFKKATIGTIIACRLKSSRLEKKALLNIGNITSVEKCIQSCMRFKNTHYTILATSVNEQDTPLKDYTYLSSVIYHRGDEDDVIRRYLDITEKLGIDVIIRVTADMPYVSDEITAILLADHFKYGADYTAARAASVGTAVEIINAEALRKVKEHFTKANYSEYMTWYFQNNPEHFKINLVDLPSELVRDYRLTLDYQEDLNVFNAIQNYLDTEQKYPSIHNIFSFLDENPEVVKMNNHITLTYKTDSRLIDTLNKETKIK